MYPQQKVLIKLSNGNCRLDFLSFSLNGQSQECTLQPIGEKVHSFYNGLLSASSI